MILWSNNLIRQKIYPPKNAVVRINLAWHNNFIKLKKEIKALKYSVMIDYPHGRTKLPIGNITFIEATIKLTRLKNVIYFAYSNAEQESQMRILRLKFNTVKIVPKIETAEGVLNLEEIVRAADTDTVMLDAEDLYHDTKKAYPVYLKLFEKKTKHLKVFRLQGVIFKI